jgi:putrescine transport system substrate-binding protein
MHRVRRSYRWQASIVFAIAIAIAIAIAVAMAGCGRREAAPVAARGPPAQITTPSSLTDQEKTLNVYNWADYIDPSVIPAFEQEYGIKVNYDVFESNEVLEAKLLTGSTGYDVVVPTASFMQRQIQAGIYQKLDKALLPNLKNLDASLNRDVELNDPGNQYGVIYFWGTSGVGYNEDKIEAAMPNAPVNSFAMLYDPNVVKNFKDCGVSILDQPDEVVETVLLYLGKDPNSESLQDLKAVEAVLLSIRPYVQYIDNSTYTERLANGEICMALAWNGDIGQARSRAREAGRNARFAYILAKEGAMMYFDMLAIPAGAAHPKNAHLFINYLLRPEVAAKNSSAVHYAVSNAAAYKLIVPAVYHDESIYPGDEQKSHLHSMAAHSLSYMRELNRVWTRFKTGH